MARTYAQSLRTGWVQNVTPVKEEVINITLQQFQQNVALDPQQIPQTLTTPSESTTDVPISETKGAITNTANLDTENSNILATGHTTKARTHPDRQNPQDAKRYRRQRPSQ